MLVIGHHRKIHQHNVGARGHQIGSCGPEQIENGLSGLDALTGRPADTEALTHAGFRIGIDVHPRNTESLARQCPPGRVAAARYQRRIRLRPNIGRRPDLDPRLHPPQIAARMRIVGHQDVEHLAHIGHGAGVRNYHIHGGHQWPVAAHRDHSA